MTTAYVVAIVWCLGGTCGFLSDEQLHLSEAKCRAAAQQVFLKADQNAPEGTTFLGTCISIKVSGV